MKSIKRILLGIISSLLLAVGFVRAADSLDPVLKGASGSDSNAMRVADGCTVPTDIYVS